MTHTLEAAAPPPRRPGAPAPRARRAAAGLPARLALGAGRSSNLTCPQQRSYTSPRLTRLTIITPLAITSSVHPHTVGANEVEESTDAVQSSVSGRT